MAGIIAAKAMEPLEKTPTTTSQSVRNDLDQLKARLELMERTRPSQQRDLSPIESKYRRRWFPATVLIVLLNFLLWFSMLHAVFKARDYQHHRASYLAINWLIVLVPLIIVAAAFISPVPRAFKETLRTLTLRDASQHLSIVNILNALACFTFVTAYLYIRGIPQYNHPVWAMDLDFSLNLHIPAMAILIPASSSGISLGLLPESVRASAEYNGTTRTLPYRIEENFRSQFTAVVFNSSLLNVTDFTSIQDRLIIEMDVNYNSSKTNALNLNTAITTFFEVFDPRLSLNTVYDCEIANYPSMPAFASNTFNIVAEHIIDRYGLVISPSATKECGKEYHALLSEVKTPYTAYSWALESSIPTIANLSQCDVAANADARCRMAIAVSFGTHLIHTSTSRPGLSQLDIWLNAGAITGTVQFFSWFVEILMT